MSEIFLGKATEEKMTFKMAEMLIRSMAACPAQLACTFIMQASEFEIDEIPVYEVSEETKAFIRVLATIINLPGHDVITGEDYRTFYFFAPTIFRLKIKS